MLSVILLLFVSKPLLLRCNSMDDDNFFPPRNSDATRFSLRFRYSSFHERNRVQALSYIREHSNITTYDQNAVVVDPVISGCMWLLVEKLDREGLGHSLASFINYLYEAYVNKLTLVVPFFTKAHGLSDVNEFIRYFGLHTIFHGFRNVSPITNITVVNVENIMRNCDSISLKKSVDSFRQSNNHPTCDKGNVLFLCFNKNTDFALKIATSAEHVLIPLRGSFLTGYISSVTVVRKSVTLSLKNRLFRRKEESYPSVFATCVEELRVDNTCCDSYSQRRHTSI